MDAELEQKRKRYEEVLSSTYQDEDAAVIEDYMLALRHYHTEYHRIIRQRDELVRQIISGQFLGPHLVERRGNCLSQGGASRRGEVPLRVVPQLHDPGALGGPEGIVVDVQREGAVQCQGVQGEQVGGGGGVEELAGHGASEDGSLAPE